MWHNESNLPCRTTPGGAVEFGRIENGPPTHPMEHVIGEWDDGSIHSFDMTCGNLEKMQRAAKNALEPLWKGERLPSHNALVLAQVFAFTYFNVESPPRRQSPTLVCQI